MTFDQFDIHPLCLPLLAKLGIVKPTPVQEQAIPAASDGRDVLAIAETGTGKTLAFGMPAFTRLAQGEKGRNRMLVLTPTRELAQQVQKSLAPFATALGLRSTVIVGGAGMQPQIQALRQGVDIVVATPGRLLDHMQQRTVRFNHLSILVLDEADRMLDMGFIPDIRRIVATLPVERQTMLFSATFPAEIERLTMEFQHDVCRFQMAPRTAPAVGVNQHVYAVGADAKTNLLTDLLRKKEVTSAIVFIRTKHRTDRVAKQLQRDGINAEAIHGGRTQGQRERALDGFRRGKFSVLVATDVAARGIDVQGVTHVVNYDIPKTFDDYVHRIGRTGRAEATGDAFTFVTPQESKELGAIERGLGKRIPRIGWDGASVLPISSEPERAPRPKQQRSHGNAGGKPRRSGQGASKPGGNGKKQGGTHYSGNGKPSYSASGKSGGTNANARSTAPRKTENARRRDESAMPTIVVLPKEKDEVNSDSATPKLKRGTRAWRRMFKPGERTVTA